MPKFPPDPESIQSQLHFHCILKRKSTYKLMQVLGFHLSGYSDSNGGPPAPKAGALANCATPRKKAPPAFGDA